MAKEELLLAGYTEQKLEKRIKQIPYFKETGINSKRILARLWDSTLLYNADLNKADYEVGNALLIKAYEEGVERNKSPFKKNKDDLPPEIIAEIVKENAKTYRLNENRRESEKEIRERIANISRDAKLKKSVYNIDMSGTTAILPNYKLTPEQKEKIRIEEEINRANIDRKRQTCKKTGRKGIFKGQY